MQNYVVGLKNRVEANKIHTINAKINVSGGLVNVTNRDGCGTLGRNGVGRSFRGSKEIRGYIDR